MYNIKALTQTVLFVLAYAVWFLLFLPCCTACEILVSQQGFKPRPSALRVQSLNHWTARELPHMILLIYKCPKYTSSVSSTKVKSIKLRKLEHVILLLYNLKYKQVKMETLALFSVLGEKTQFFIVKYNANGRFFWQIHFIRLWKFLSDIHKSLHREWVFYFFQCFLCDY